MGYCAASWAEAVALQYATTAASPRPTRSPVPAAAAAGAKAANTPAPIIGPSPITVASVVPSLRVEHQVELVIDAGACDGEVTTVIDLSAETPRLVREGAGDIRPFGFVKEALH